MNSLINLALIGASGVVGKKIIYKCDCLGISGGWTPAVHLFTQSGGKLKFDNEDNVFIPSKYPSHI